MSPINNLFVFCFSLLLLACHPDFKKISLSYNIDHYPLEKLEDAYKDVPIYKQQDINHIIQKLSLIVLKRYNPHKRGTCTFQVFMREDGEVESIFKIQAFDSSFDDMAVEAIKESQFKKMNYHGKPIRYSILISFSYSGNKKIYPVINGMPTDPGFSKNILLSNKHPAPDKLYPMDSVDEQPEAIYSESPYYPDLARSSVIEGTVIVSIVINERGRVIKTKIVKSIPMLDQSAEETAKHLIFKPGSLKGKPVKVAMNMSFMYDPVYLFQNIS